MKKIIISQNVIQYLAPESRENELVLPTDNIITSITTLISQNPGEPLFSLIFVHTRDFDNVYYFLKRFTYNDILYRVVIIDPEARQNFFSEEKMDVIIDFRSSVIKPVELDFIIDKGFHILEEFYGHMHQKDEYLMQLLDTKQDQEDLINIGKSLSIEKDPDKLLRLILLLSKKITGADAGSIYLIEELEEGGKQMRFKYSHTFSKEIPMEEFVMPYDKKSIAGYVAITGKVLNIDDVYNLPKGAPISFNSSFDQQNNYRSRSMLVVPMRNHIDQIIGVIQLINSKEDMRGTNKVTGNEAFEIRLITPEDFETKVVSFESRYEGLMESVASQAAIAIENNRMIKQIETQFEEFVKASVTAIESRDVATSGHSFRVSEICKMMARAINSETAGCFADIQFSEVAIKELEYAALLHDFGKVYIDLAIFMKGKKLFPKDYDNVMLKINYLYRLIELQFLANENRLLADNIEEDQPDLDVEQIRLEKERKLETIRKIKEIIQRLNEPTVTEKDPSLILDEVLNEVNFVTCRDIEGKEICVISDDEKVNLSIQRGSLNPQERKEIESHVVHTYNFVSKIPWPPGFKNIPEFALKHHEMLDGSGYPYGLKGKENIPIQARMMAIADIYDALTASDRPYKKAIPVPRALAILDEEAQKGKIDRELLDIFVKNHIYELISKDDYREM